MQSGPAEKPKIDNLIILFFALFLAANAAVWSDVVFGEYSGDPKIYFLNVGQGDSELVIFPGNVKVLTDAGPNSKITAELEKIPELADRYIDIAIITHPQADHFGGFAYLLDKYRIGAFVYNGRSDSPGVQSWDDLVEKIKEAKIPMVRLAADDSIKYSAGKIDFLSPDSKLVQSAELNDTGMVEMVKYGDLRALLAADIDQKTEDYLAGRDDLRADILKVAHHGSKYSSSMAFLEAIRPKVAVIEVGAGNNYGHPSADALQRLSSLAHVFRTDKNGQVSVTATGGKLDVFAER